MIKYYCDKCNYESSEEEELFKLNLPVPEFIGKNNISSEEFYINEIHLCQDCTQKLYNLIYNRNKPWSLNNEI